MTVPVPTDSARRSKRTASSLSRISGNTGMTSNTFPGLHAKTTLIRPASGMNCSERFGALTQQDGRHYGRVAVCQGLADISGDISTGTAKDMTWPSLRYGMALGRASATRTSSPRLSPPGTPIASSKKRVATVTVRYFPAGPMDLKIPVATPPAHYFPLRLSRRGRRQEHEQCCQAAVGGRTKTGREGPSAGCTGIQAESRRLP